MGSIMEQWGDNEQIAGIIIGAMVDGALTGINQGQNLHFESSMAQLQGEIQAGLETLKTSNQIELIGAEGAMAGDLIDKQGSNQRENTLLQNQGKLDQIGAAGQANLNQINAQGAVDINKLNAASQNKLNEIGAQGDIQKDLLFQKGQLDKELTMMKGDIDLTKLGAMGQNKLNEINDRAFIGRLWWNRGCCLCSGNKT